ncbi:cyclin-like protein involved in autophagy Clg1 [Schizosaccharomyces osmophilus]|uniref:Cyclin-like protein involved in autophagy Clg1 n=1 Tax=Schizosaccharomyces osmophilus TaxID=2545709 RepID=A0AAE9WDQ0_9SCHI|nr:cyclin-like protein involved in autophagy Clg1 [Schizosaccharomyces osmophilus]WBW73317.1 cyclin-like protein involved in autophagy Clg1 [Schizosaccharomyces osmophilus]
MAFSYQHTDRPQAPPSAAAPGFGMFAPVLSSNNANSAASVAALLSHTPMYGLGQRRPSFLPGVSVPDSFPGKSGISIPSSTSNSHHIRTSSNQNNGVSGSSAAPFLSQQRLQQRFPPPAPTAPSNYYWPSYQQSVPAAGQSQRYLAPEKYPLAYHPSAQNPALGNPMMLNPSGQVSYSSLIPGSRGTSYYDSLPNVGPMNCHASVPPQASNPAASANVPATMGNCYDPNVCNVAPPAGQRISPQYQAGSNAMDQDDLSNTGGVSANLDYKMDQMVEYLSIMTCKLYARFLNNARMHSLATSLPNLVFSFRKFVLQVLTSTRLPRASCLLALSYISDRLDAASQSSEFLNQWTKETPFFQICALLTSALILANKYLDDNTFTNQSWSQVTGFRTQLLNKFEQDWLVSMSWNLNPGSRGHKAWEWWSASYALFTSSNNGNINHHHDQSQGPDQFNTNSSPVNRTCSDYNYYYPYSQVGYFPMYTRYAMT